MLNSNGTRKSAGDMGATAPAGWTVVGVGDINGDGVPDLIWRNGTTGQMSYWMLNSNGTRKSAGDMGATAPAGWTVVGVGDIDGDGVPDLIWRNGTTGQMSYWMLNSNGTRKSAGDMGATAPAGWTVVGVGDINGDGVPDLIWRNGTTGQMAYWMLNSNGTRKSAGDMGATAPAGWTVVGVGV
jgi:uncharacterized protein YbdZ (MbtH family)